MVPTTSLSLLHLGQFSAGTKIRHHDTSPNTSTTKWIKESVSCVRENTHRAFVEMEDGAIKENVSLTTLIASDRPSASTSTTTRNKAAAPS